MRSFLLRALMCATTLCPTPAHAIIHFYATGVFTCRPITPECPEAGTFSSVSLPEFPHPSHWTYIIVCDDQARSKVIQMDGLADIGSNVFGTTSLKYATT